MKNNDQLILEQAYQAIATNGSSKSFEYLVYENNQLIDQLIEEGFGDYLKKVGGAIKGGVQKAASKIKETLTSGVAKTLVNAVLSVVPKEELEKMVNIIAKGKVPKEEVLKLKNELVQADTKSPVKESRKEIKNELANLLFTEENIIEALKASNPILLEAKNINELNKFAKEVASKINALYPKSKNLGSALNRFNKSVAKTLNVPLPTSQQPTPEINNQQVSQTQPSSVNQSPQNQQPSSPQQSQEDQEPQTGKKWFHQLKPGEFVDGPDSEENKNKKSLLDMLPEGNGIVGKVSAFIKKRPVLSAVAGAALIGLVAAAFAGSAPVIMPALVRGIIGAGVGGTTSIVQQLMSGKEEIDWKQVGKTAAIAGSATAAASILFQGLGTIISGIQSFINFATPQDFTQSSSQEVYRNGQKVFGSETISGGTKQWGKVIPGTDWNQTTVSYGS
jgi:hypothetical protein